MMLRGHFWSSSKGTQAPGHHPGTTRAQRGHNPIHGHTGPRAPGHNPIHGHTGTRAHGQGPPEHCPRSVGFVQNQGTPKIDST